MKFRHLGKAAALAAVLGTLALGVRFRATASDHDDGENDIKSRALNLTDVYVFREDWQKSGGSSEHLVAIMNTTPRALARQQYPFSTRALYSFHFSRVSNVKSTPDGSDDVVISFEFSTPDDAGRQQAYITVVRDGHRIASGTLPGMETTTLAESDAGNLNVIDFTAAGYGMKLFAGLREDPFFFDVERYFRVRSFLAGGPPLPSQGGSTIFRNPDRAVDFAAGYNVNSIVLRLPISLIGTSAADVWATISLKH